MQTTGKAVDFYDGKIKGLDSNLRELEQIVQSKSTQLRLVEEGECQFMSVSLSTSANASNQSSSKSCSAERVLLLPLPRALAEEHEKKCKR